MSFQPDRDGKILFSGKSSGKKESETILAMPKPITFLQVYAPTSSHDDASIEEFYEQLQSAIDKIKKGDMCNHG